MAGPRKDYQRSERVADQLQRELADLIRTELKDPRVGMVTLSETEVSRDLSHARVFFSVLGGEAESAEVEKGLNNAAGFLRSQIGRRMRLRVVPTLRFVYDDSIARGAELSAVIDAAVRDDAVRHVDSPDELNEDVSDDAGHLAGSDASGGTGDEDSESRQDDGSTSR